MSRLDAWLQELYFEDNNTLRRRTSRIASVIAKSVMTIPHAFMFFFCNFGSSMPSRRSSSEPVPRDVSMDEIALREWPQSARTGFDRGLPYSDDSIAVLDLGTCLSRVHDVAFVLGEIRRVCHSGARLHIRFTNPDDPFHARAICRRSIDYILDATFALERETADGVSITVQKPEPPAVAVPRRIDIGCGATPRAGYVGIDLVDLPEVGIVRDVERHGLPLSESTVTHVHTAHFLEHVNDLVFVMNEIHRVCCPDAIVTISVPTLLGPFATADPTHVHHFNARTFTYFEPGDEPYAGITKGFEILRQRVSFSLEVTLRVIKSARTPSAQTAR